MKMVTGMVSLAALAVALWGIPVASYSGAAHATPQIHNRMITHSHSGGGDDNGDDHGGNHGNNGGGDDHNTGGGGSDDGCEDGGKHGKHCHGVPEPSTLALFTLGIAGITVSNLARRRRVKA
jgi:PEP-CTERM motif